MDFGAMTFEEALAATDGQQRTLLLGAGFSPPGFGYTSLLDKAGESDAEGAPPLLPEDDPLRGLFRGLDTQNFEEIIAMLDAARDRALVSHESARAEAYAAKAERLRRILIKVIAAVHPDSRGDPAHGFECVGAFLRRFSRLFTLNYDLFLYWSVIDGEGRWPDGFGRKRTPPPGLMGPYLQREDTKLFNLHGGIHLFAEETGEVLKARRSPGTNLTAVIAGLLDEGRLPLYVAEGDSVAKTRAIAASPYLRHCLAALKKTRGPIFTFGHSASESDAHVYETIFRSDATHLYVGYFDPDEAEGMIARLEGWRAAQGGTISITLYSTAHEKLWPDPLA